jgi:hypothetical protein
MLPVANNYRPPILHHPFPTIFAWIFNHQRQIKMVVDFLKYVFSSGLKRWMPHPQDPNFYFDPSNYYDLKHLSLSNYDPRLSPSRFG